LVKPAQLASRTTTPELKPNHEKLPSPRSTPSAPPQEASFPPPQSESKLSHSRSAAVPSPPWTAAALLPLLGKPALLASRTTTPALKPNHDKPPSPRSTPSAPPQEASFPPPQSESKLSHSRSAAVPRRFSSARSSASALAKPALLASRTTTPALKPNHDKPPSPRSTPSPPPQEASFPPPQSESKLSHSRSAAVPSRPWTAAALLPLLGKPALLASRTTTPALQPNHEKLLSSSPHVA